MSQNVQINAKMTAPVITLYVTQTFHKLTGNSALKIAV